jgi:pimeloyl-ACP methyl ester carboxylesterase
MEKESFRKMKKICLFLLIFSFLRPAAGLTPSRLKIVSPAREVNFQTEDGIKVYADIYESAKGKKGPLILLFHQGGGDARGEYGPYIAPRLVESGFNVMAVDQRLGGNYFQGTNRTVAGVKGKEYRFCDAYPDLKAALRYAVKNGFTGKRLVWGSSYSATLALRLAGEFPKDVAGVLAFSPAGGEPMNGCQPADFVSALKVPVLALRPASEMERETAKQQFLLFEQHNFLTYIAADGVHGSSMLDPQRVTAKTGIEKSWGRVLDFINQALTTKR